MKNMKLKNNTGLLADILQYLEKNNISLMESLSDEVHHEACCKELHITEESWPDEKYHLPSHAAQYFSRRNNTNN